MKKEQKWALRGACVAYMCALLLLPWRVILDPLPVEDEAGADLRAAWKQVAKGIDTVMAQINVQEILDSSSHENMYYI